MNQDYKYDGLIHTMILGGCSLIDNPFRLGSEEYGVFMRRARTLYRLGELDDLDEENFFILESDAGELMGYHGETVMLDTPVADLDKGTVVMYTFDGDEVLRLEHPMPV